MYRLQALFESYVYLAAQIGGYVKLQTFQCQLPVPVTSELYYIGVLSPYESYKRVY